MDPVTARRMVAILVAAYPREALEPASVDVYTAALAELDSLPALEQTVRTIIRSSPRFPSISELRETYLEIRRREPKPKEIEAILVGPPSEAVEAIRQLGETLKSPDLVAFADRLTTENSDILPS